LFTASARHTSSPSPALSWCSGGESQADADEDDSCKSWCNHRQVAVAAAAVARLLASERGVGAGDVGVISPYRGQVRAIARAVPTAMRSAPTSRPPPTTRKNARSSQAEADVDAATVEVSTVDGFQGCEKEVIVLSTVRSNAARRLGFLRDGGRRVNVALTRARRGLVVIGDANTLAASGLWAAWLTWARSSGRVPLVLPESAVLGK
jgi:superfamily I DNA and/or RNA helicase